MPNNISTNIAPRKPRDGTQFHGISTWYSWIRCAWPEWSEGLHHHANPTAGLKHTKHEWDDSSHTMRYVGIRSAQSVAILEGWMCVVLRKYRALKSIAWSNEMVRSGIGARMDIFSRTSNVECIASISQVMAILLGLRERKSSKRTTLRRRVTLHPLRLSHYLLPHQLVPRPNPLTLAIRRNFHFWSLFSQHWWLKRVFLKMRLRRSGMRHVLLWETRWPRIKKGDYNGLFLTSIYILYSGCHFYPSSTSTNYTTSNDAVYGIINQASNSVASLRGEPISENNVRSSSLVNSFNGSMHCIHSPDRLLSFTRASMTLAQRIVSDLLLTFCLNQFRELISRSSMMIQTLIYATDLITRWSVADSTEQDSLFEGCHKKQDYNCAWLPNDKSTWRNRRLPSPPQINLSVCL